MDTLVARSNNAKLLELIKTRRSTRAFRPDPVPRTLVREVLDAAANAPSWGNTQPWEFAVITGPLLDKMKVALSSRVANGEAFRPDVRFPEFADPYRDRYRRNGARMYEAMGIPREDKARRTAFSLSMHAFFGAPAGIIVYMDAALGAYSMLDLGLAMQNIFIAANCLGLGTCPLAYTAIYPDVLRELLHLPESKQIICGIAVGYPIEDAPVNVFRSQREPLDGLVTWHGED